MVPTHWSPTFSSPSWFGSSDGRSTWRHRIEAESSTRTSGPILTSRVWPPRTFSRRVSTAVGAADGEAAPGVEDPSAEGAPAVGTGTLSLQAAAAPTARVRSGRVRA